MIEDRNNVGSSLDLTYDRNVRISPSEFVSLSGSFHREAKRFVRRDTDSFRDDSATQGRQLPVVDVQMRPATDSRPRGSRRLF
jgi:hypothetical protein